MTGEEFGQVLTVLQAGFGMTLTVGQQEVWFGTLAPMPGEAVKRAAKSMCREWPHDRRPWVSDLYQVAKQYAPIAPSPSRALPEPDRSPLREEARMLLATIGAGGEPGPNAIPIESAVEIIAEKVRDAHPGASMRTVYRAVIAAICGQGEHAALWLLLRRRAPTPAEIVEVTVA